MRRQHSENLSFLYSCYRPICFYMKRMSNNQMHVTNLFVSVQHNIYKP